MKLPSGVMTQTFASPLRFSGKSFPIYRRPPPLGEHNAEIVDVNPAQLASAHE